jgi:hypothetical protein
MYLGILEDYIVSLASEAVDRPNKVKKISVVVGELMDVMIQQEILYPDIIFDGDAINKEIKMEELLTKQKKELKMLKKTTWLFATVTIGLVCFLFGFFAAP